MSDDNTEHTPLLDADESQTDKPAAPTPLPWRALTVLLFLAAAQPLAFELIFPFINQMLVFLRVVDDPERVGFYSGIIESIFSVSSLLTIIPTSYASDHYGRKPVILVGIAGLGLSVICFGMSRSFLTLILSRCIGGGMGGVWASIKIMLGELTDRSNQDTAFMGLMISYRMGQTIGLPIGGFLAHPERHWPGGVFEGPFWKAYPFALPCFVGAGFAIGASLVGAFLLEETLPSKVKHTKLAAHTDESGNVIPDVLPPSPSSETKPKHVSFRSVLTPEVTNLLISNLCMCLASEATFVLYPIFAFTPVASGGLGFSEGQIGGYLSIRALLQIGIMFLFRSLLRSPLARGSSVRLYQFAMIIWPITIACYPLLNLLVRGGRGWMFEGVQVVFFVVWGFGGYCWTAVNIMTNNASPSAEALATLNGVYQMSVILPQAIAPAFTTSLFAFSVDKNILGGRFVWVVFFVLTAFGAIHAQTLKEPKTDWREEAKKGLGTPRPGASRATSSDSVETTARDDAPRA